MFDQISAELNNNHFYKCSNYRGIGLDVKFDNETSLEETVIPYIESLKIFPDRFAYGPISGLWFFPSLVFENNKIIFNPQPFKDQMYDCKFDAFVIDDLWSLAVYQKEVVKLDEESLKDIKKVLSLNEVVLMPVKDEGNAFLIFDETYMEELG